MRFAVMVEGQEDVTWEQWRALAATDRAAGVRGAAALGPLRLGRRRHRPRVARRVVDDLRAGGDDEHPAARDARLARHVPPPVRPGQVRGDGRPHLGRADRGRDRDGLARGRAPRLRLPVPADEGPHGPARRAARDHRRLVGARPVLVRRRALRGRGPRRAAQAGPGPAAAADGRGRGPARRGARRALRDGVQRRPPDAGGRRTRRASGSPPRARRPAATRRR